MRIVACSLKMLRSVLGSVSGTSDSVKMRVDVFWWVLVIARVVSAFVLFLLGILLVFFPHVLQ